MQFRLRFVPSRVTLGSVQFGMTYGIANVLGQPNEAEAFRVLDRAFELGINTIDTARGYGTAEATIGKWLASRRLTGVHVVTKMPKVPTGSEESRRHFVSEQIAASKRVLQIECLPLILTHEESDLFDPIVAEEFQAALASGSIQAFGASVYDPGIAKRLMATTPIAALQVPANIADRRFEEAGVFRDAVARGIAVFARSVLLQGLLLMSSDRLPDHLKAFTPLLTALGEAARTNGRSIAELLIPAVRDVPGVTSIVLGVDIAGQLEADMKAALAPPLPAGVREDLIRAASSIPQEILIPASWKRPARQT